MHIILTPALPLGQSQKGAFAIHIWSILTKASQRLPLRILDLEFFHQNPLRTSRDDHWDH